MLPKRSPTPFPSAFPGQGNPSATLNQHQSSSVPRTTPILQNPAYYPNIFGAYNPQGVPYPIDSSYNQPNFAYNQVNYSPAGSKSPYSNINTAKVRFQLYNSTKNPKSPTPANPGVTYLPEQGYPGYPAFTYNNNPGWNPQNPSSNVPLINPQQAQLQQQFEQQRFQFEQQQKQQLFQQLLEFFNSPIPEANLKKKKKEVRKPFFSDFHFNDKAFNSNFMPDKMYYFQIISFQEDKTGPLREELLFRQFFAKTNSYSSTGILVKFVQQNLNHKKWCLETQPGYDPTLDPTYVGYKNVGFVKNLDFFLDIACYLPVPLDSADEDPRTHSIPLTSFRAWSSMLIMEARNRSVLILNPALSTSTRQ